MEVRKLQYHLPIPALGVCKSVGSIPNKVSVFQNPIKTEPKFSRSRVCLKCYCNKNGDTDKSPEGFSVLKSDVPCDIGSIWSTMALYIFSCHIPLSFGGLSIVAQVLHQSVLDQQTQAISILALQMLELVAVSLLLSFTTEPPYKLFSYFEVNKSTNERNWLLALVIGFGFLVFLVFLTSLLADRLMGPKDVNNPILKEILLSGSIPLVASSFIYCFISPLLEETVYRGFLLKYLASTMEWQRAVLISSAVFSAAHLSGENFLQLFIIGCVLGCSYCWTGKLSSSIAIHSLYNALTLLITYTS